MKAQILDKTVEDIRKSPDPLELVQREVPDPQPGQILVRVAACGVCHTELDEIEGRTPPPQLPVVPGHQVVGTVVALGEGVSRFPVGERVGIAWIYSTCGRCEYCRDGRENLCPEFRATGRDVDGGYAEFMVVGEDFATGIPDSLSDIQAAPLLCAGAIGYRSLKLTGLENGQRLGLTGFGGSGHLVLKMVRFLYPETEVFVFARNPLEREFSLELGAVWAGDTGDTPPALMHAIIDTTPAWTPVVSALASLVPGGRLVINAIRKEDRDRDALQALDYARHLWLEKEIKSVANVCRNDISGFLDLADRLSIVPQVQVYPLEEANRALYDLKTGAVRGARVLSIG
ncbi:zinc-dependent alcohol dehydrogenase family protein [Desulfolithobacter sp.]